MTKNKYTKIIMTGLGILLLLFVLYLVFISYITSNGLRDYQAFCGKYIPVIEQFKEKHKHYPDSLALFVKPEYYPRYEPDKCLYYPKENGYVIFAPSGLIGNYIYSSETKEWHYD